MILSFSFAVCADKPSQTTAVIYSLRCWVAAEVAAISVYCRESHGQRALHQGVGCLSMHTPKRAGLLCIGEKGSGLGCQRPPGFCCPEVTWAGPTSFRVQAVLSEWSA